MHNFDLVQIIELQKYAKIIKKSFFATKCIFIYPICYTYCLMFGNRFELWSTAFDSGFLPVGCNVRKII